MCLQEIIVSEGKHEFEKGDLQLYTGKLQDEWRGTAILYTDSFQLSQAKLLKAGTCCTLRAGKFCLKVLSGHLPHHATVAETEEILATWRPQLEGEHRCLVGLDANETFRPGRGMSILSNSARGELLLDALGATGLKLPPQNLASPSYFPYNTQMSPRRLDYLFVRHLLSDEGGVLDCRDLARSDHEAVHLPLTSPTIRPHSKATKTWGIRKLRPWPEIELLLGQHKPISGDPVQAIAEIARAITKPGKQIDQFRESREVRALRRCLLHTPPGPERKQRWKALAKQRRAEHRAWSQAKLAAAGAGFWQSKKAVDQDKHDTAWELRLRSQDRWRDTLAEHFGGIFKLDPHRVAERMRGILARMTRRCKDQP